MYGEQIIMYNEFPLEKLWLTMEIAPKWAAWLDAVSLLKGPFALADQEGLLAISECFEL